MDVEIHASTFLASLAMIVIALALIAYAARKL